MRFIKLGDLTELHVFTPGAQHAGHCQLTLLGRADEQQPAASWRKLLRQMPALHTIIWVWLKNWNHEVLLQALLQRYTGFFSQAHRQSPNFSHKDERTPALCNQEALWPSKYSNVSQLLLLRWLRLLATGVLIRPLAATSGASHRGHGVLS